MQDSKPAGGPRGLTSLYRFYDASGALLYVGITSRGPERFGAHRRTQPWWCDVTTCRIEHYPDRDSALAAESIAITREHPAHNIAGTGRPHRPRVWTSDDFNDVDLIDVAMHTGSPTRSTNGMHRHGYQSWVNDPLTWCACAYRRECGWDSPPLDVSGRDGSAAYYTVKRSRIVAFIVVDYLDGMRAVMHAWTAIEHRREGLASLLIDHAAADGAIEAYDGPFTPDGHGLVMSRPNSERGGGTRQWMSRPCHVNTARSVAMEAA